MMRAVVVSLSAVLALAVLPSCKEIKEGFKEGLKEGLEEQGVAPKKMATATQCEQMMRNGTRLKALQGGPFAKLSPAEQKKNLDNVMKDPKMVEAISQCPTQVPAKLATCIIAAKNLTAYEACKRLE